MDNFHLIVVYFISLSIIGIEGENWDEKWYEDYYPAPPQSPGAGNPAPLPARHPSPPQPAQQTARQSSPPQPAQQTARQSSPPQPAQQTMRQAELAPQQALQQVPQQAWQRASQQAWLPAPPMHLTSDQHKNKRPASPSGPSSAPKRQNTGVSSSSTSSPVNTIAGAQSILLQ
ncbi:predicted GPI-anchored protein 58 isoform X2 [Nilaparvata lugens]|uniref:predicted GPI-anchored protein 58 isoform X2 n=1 Tax=Nilaparvata lugens TaxID=108931 RepID=UPI00193CC07C|nr:predicted GPI-anchored protein 58 isoform X2 [Nilaparvata lugens]